MILRWSSRSLRGRRGSRLLHMWRILCSRRRPAFRSIQYNSQSTWCRCSIRTWWWSRHSQSNSQCIRLPTQIWWLHNSSRCMSNNRRSRSCTCQFSKLCSSQSVTRSSSSSNRMNHIRSLTINISNRFSTCSVSSHRLMSSSRHSTREVFRELRLYRRRAVLTLIGFRHIREETLTRDSQVRWKLNHLPSFTRRQWSQKSKEGSNHRQREL